MLRPCLWCCGARHVKGGRVFAGRVEVYMSICCCREDKADVVKNGWAQTWIPAHLLASATVGASVSSAPVGAGALVRTVSLARKAAGAFCRIISHPQ